MHTSEPIIDRLRRQVAGQTVELDAGEVLRLALDGSPSDCVAVAGVSQTRVVQRALQLVVDVEIAAQHPELARRILDRVERQRMKRRSSSVRNEGAA